MNSQCQVDLIDMQSEPDRYYRFIMNYQDHLTKFTILRPLKSKSAKKVAYYNTKLGCYVARNEARAWKAETF